MGNSDDETNQTTKYIHNIPTSLPLYCKEFSNNQDDVNINNTTQLHTCVGVNGYSHLFMTTELHTSCTKM